MKKILLFALAILSAATYAQIGPIQTEEKPIEFISGYHLYRIKAADEYILQIISSNEFEDTAVKLSLGHGADEAMASLRSVFDIFGASDRQFRLQGYTFQVQNSSIYGIHVGKLEYTAGDYTLYKRSVSEAMYNLMTKKDMPIDTVSVIYYAPSAVFVRYPAYGFERVVNLTNVTIPYSRAYTNGDAIDAVDLELLKNVATNPDAYRSKGAQRASSVYDKTELIRACDIILNKIVTNL